MREISFQFEELPLGSVTSADGLVCRLEVCAWGRATIEYGRGDWRVSAIEVDAAARIDGRWVTRSAPLDRKSPLFKPIADALRESQAEWIEERIADDMRENGVAIGNPNAEHSTLNHQQQGLSR